MKYLILVILASLMVGCTDECKDPNRPWNMFDHCNPKRPLSTPTPTPTPSKPHRCPVHKPKRISCGSETAIVAVIDTGFTYSEYTKNVKLCKFGHKNFTGNKEEYLPNDLNIPVPIDHHGHGTNVVGIIQQYAGNSNYCMIIIKYFDPLQQNENNLKNTVEAIEYATRLGARYINYSGGGIEASLNEKSAIEKFLNQGGKFIAAAGNEKSDIAKHPYYPAMYDSRIISVGSIENNGKIAKYSNYGKAIKRWEHGSNVFAFGITQSGTSQATAIATGKIIKSEENEK